MNLQPMWDWIVNFFHYLINFFHPKEIARLSNEHPKPINLHNMKGYGISLLVPFQSDSGRRAETWEWLKQYWAYELPYAELIVGGYKHRPFSKTTAVNEAARKATGDIIVILDADCYIPGDVIVECAVKIREARAQDQHLWYIPYRHFYRMTDSASRLIISSNPVMPPRYFSSAPPLSQLESGPASSAGHHYGALIQIMPIEAFVAARGMDERFAGWGGEDVSFLHAVDTMWGRYKTLPSGVIHLWHPTFNESGFKRNWVGQDKTNPNSNLASRYGAASSDYAKMLALVNEHKSFRDKE